jgi:hypothetical protein
VKEVTLSPYQLPDLVESFIRKVECFDEHNAAFIASDQGALLLYGEEQVVFNAKTFDELPALDWDEVEVLYAPSTEIFWIISDSIYLQLGKNTYEVYVDGTPFYGPTRAYYAHVLSPEGALYRIGFYKEFWDQSSGSFFSDYYLAIYRYLGQPNNAWTEYQTDLTVNSPFLTTPTAVFAENGDLIINTNPTYVVRDFTGGQVNANAYPKTGDGFTFKTSYVPHIGTDDRLYGLNIEPSFYSPASDLFVSTLVDESVDRLDLDGLCTLPDGSQGIVKLIDWKGTVARFYIGYFTNNLSTETEALGYILSYNVVGGNCDLKRLVPGDKLKLSESIQDLDVYGDEVYIGTRDGLLVYDLETDFMESYLGQLLQKNAAQQ